MYQKATAERKSACDNIKRIGGTGDGGKQICIDHMKRNQCVVYSLGFRLDFAFEMDVVKRLGCEVHTFDCTMGTPNDTVVPDGIVFHPWCVGGKDEIKVISSDLGHLGESGQYYTLTTIQAMLKHQAIDLLKMDIERYEFTFMASFTLALAPRQLAFETHLYNAYGMWGRPVTDSEWST